MKRRIVAVIVLYKTISERSLSYQSLLRTAQQASSDRLDLLIILHDNTPGTVSPENLPSNVLFMADSTNSGLATAYNQALTVASEDGYDWLLTLDQDTELPPDFFDILLGITAKLDDQPNVAAVVPQIHANGRVLSPHYFIAGTWPRILPPGFTGISRHTVYAFNSGALIRVAALQQIGGYSPWFWLDHSDSYLYRQLSKFGKQVYVVSELKLNHDFSVLNIQERVSPERYQTILLAEAAFWDLEMNMFARLERTIKLIGRVSKHWLRKDSLDLRKLATQALWLRLFRSREYRIAAWRKHTVEKLAKTPENWVPPNRPMVSVCMATYNGERFISRQIQTILSQLMPEDELIISDDSSTDNTLAIIESFCDKRVRVFRNQTFHSPIYNFEHALKQACGQVIFMSDQDDEWVEGRIEAALRELKNVSLVVCDLEMIDENGNILASPEHKIYTHTRKPGVFQNLYYRRNGYIGCCCAFRREVLELALPFPIKLPWHDWWIGLVADSFFSTKFIEDKLVRYRRHGANASTTGGKSPFKWNKKISMRMRLSFELARLWVRYR